MCIDKKTLGNINQVNAGPWGGEREQAECVYIYIFQENQIVLGLVWVQDLLWCLSAAQLALLTLSYGKASLLCSEKSLGCFWSHVVTKRVLDEMGHLLTLLDKMGLDEMGSDEMGLDEIG